MKQFEKVPVNRPKSSLFDLSHERKYTMAMGKLVPNFISEILPGDNFRVNTEILLRFQPLLAPIMHRVNVYQHYFFVPYRIIWDEWEDFITGGTTGKVEPNHPKLNLTATQMAGWFVNNGLGDYLGMPTNAEISGTDVLSISQLPFRAYQQIYNDYYRDQNMTNEIDFDKGSNNVINTDTAEIHKLIDIRTRCWEKDYFTSALPFAQRGDAVSLPLGVSAPVSGLPKWERRDGGGAPTTGALSTNYNYILDTAGHNLAVIKQAGSVSDQLKADLSQATAATISDLRTAFSLQRWMEKNARGGARYIEQMLSHFGVKSKDSRLQRAEYLGGGKIPVQISEVLQTGASTIASQEAGTPQGNMAGHAYSAGIASGFKQFFTEHGFVIGIISVMPRTAYQNGLPKIFSKFDRFDYYFPDFAHIGEQPVQNKEIFLSGNGTTNEETFGYQPRYSEYRFMQDTVHGDLKDSLDFWHLGRKFTGLPALNEAFVNCIPSNRIFPVESDPNYLIIQQYTSCQAIRPVSKYGEPI